MVVVFIVGGSISSLGKGIAASALGAILRSDGYSLRLKKFDPYLNVDPGTMSPYQHGEVFVTQDGGEVDLDFGSYERFTNVANLKTDSLSSGKIYSRIIEEERQGLFLGQTIQVVPHITQAIAQEMTKGEEGDVVVCEIGGTVGDMEIQPFLEAIRQVRQKLGPQKTLVIHMGWVPFFAPSGEVKTKLIQHSTKELLHAGIQPDILIARCDKPLPPSIREKIALFCNVPKENVVDAPSVKNIYETILMYHNNGLGRAVYEHFQFPESQRIFEKIPLPSEDQLFDHGDYFSSKNSLEKTDSQETQDDHHVFFQNVCSKKNPEDNVNNNPKGYFSSSLDSSETKEHHQDQFKKTKGVSLKCWQRICYGLQHPEEEVSIAIVGKYVYMDDAYRSLLEALTHGGLAKNTKVHINMIDAEQLETKYSPQELLSQNHGILVPGGFGHRGIEGMIKAIFYSRQEKIPFFGICLGMQLTVIEAFRHLPGFEKATSSEFVSAEDIAQHRYPFVVALLKEWMTEGELRACQTMMGGTMRLGTYGSYLKKDSLVSTIYGKSLVFERHRHRYEINGIYGQDLQKTGLVVSGLHPKDPSWNLNDNQEEAFKNLDGLVEVVERPDHPWFLAVQSHPEFLSRPFSPHPLFSSFVEACLKRKTTF